MADGSDRGDRGSTIPLVLGFFLLALAVVAGSIALGQAFVQQRDLQSVCDGAAVAAAASGGDLDRDADLGARDSLRFTDVDAEVERYLARDPSRHGVRARAGLSADRTRVTLRCEQTLPLAFGRLFGRADVRHTAVSTARAAVVG
ncbi:Putative Flp pilus-assembly TadE/G-like [Jatrophihabitans endophyticus]|uniref:Putative Flp pilus-assembly TadE/G-like n=1 Tax=Jatrophihabitans endophyticus TaxID=1206085 RepID=A0A1M5RT45_9ACTN|nr:pilus assembly protein TadG-related protein [Jatrophihabitans endophyticus]SHH29360.1 Putative Flp pilus-assembly TadE/G-like [Jatrophihabitans endophyticus]